MKHTHIVLEFMLKISLLFFQVNEPTLIHMYVYAYIHCTFINNETYTYCSGIYVKNIIVIFPGE